MSKYESFRPERALLSKYRLIFAISAFLVWLVPVLFTWFIVVVDDEPVSTIFYVMRLTTYIAAPIFIISYLFIKPYYSSIAFEVISDEIHVNRGIITRSRKIVPYRTITNIEIKRGPFDRLFKIGTVEIQTAGISGSSGGPEERLDGVSNSELEEIQRTIIDRVRKIKGSPGTSHDIDEPDDVLGAILKEVRTLRDILSKK